jgi:hypothetical protein
MTSISSRCSRVIALGLAAGALAFSGADRARAEAQLLIEASTG